MPCKPVFLFLYFLPVLLAGIPVHAQVPVPVTHKYYAEHFGEEEGLLQNSINGIYPDANDFLWIATEGGITRFNGNRFLAVPTARSIQGQHITRTKGFYLKSRDTLLAFSAANFQMATIVNNTIVMIQRAGIEQYGIPFLNLHTTIPAPPYLTRPGPEADGITKNWDIKNGAPVGGVYHKDTFMVVLTDGVGIYTAHGQIGAIKIARDITSNVLFSGGQILYVDPQHFIHFYSLSGLVKKEWLPIAPKGTIKVFPNPYGDNFFCVSDTKLYTVSTKGEKIIILEILNNLLHPEDISVIYQKDTNTIVTGTSRNGLYIYKKQYLNTTEALPGNEPDVFYGQQLLADNQTVFTGLDKFFRKGVFIRKAPAKISTDIYSSIKDSQGNYWYIFFNHILRTKDIGTAADTILTLKGIPALFFEDGQGRIWLRDEEQFGYYSDGKFTSLPISNLPHRLISCMRQDKAGRYWIGTRSGLFVLENLTARKVREIPAFRLMDVRFLLPEEDGSLWACTYGHGFYCITAREEIIGFPQAGGKLSYVHSLIKDNRDYYWMPTNNGLFVTSRESLNAYINNKNETPFYYQFSKKHGLRTNEFNGGGEPAFLRMPDGSISLPSMQGLVDFKPEEINFNFSSSPILVDRILADSLEIMQPDAFAISSNTSSIRFSVSSSFWGEKENDLLEYQLVFDQQGNSEAGVWVPVDGTGIITLFSPAHGNYQLVIRKRKGLKHGDYIYKVIRFYVLPKWYQTTAFFAAVSVLSFLTIAGLWVWRRNYYRRANRLLKEKVDAATNELQQANNTLEEKVVQRTAAIQEAERKFRDLVEQSLVGVYIFKGGKFTYVNPRFAEIFGYSQQELTTNLPVEQLIYEPDQAIVKEHIGNAIRNYSTNEIHYEMRGIRQDGSLIYTEIFGRKTQLEGGESIIGTLIDITEKKLAETEREQANYDLNERIKELTTLYRAGLILQKEEKSFVMTMQELVSIIPAGWQYPDITTARITVGKMEFATPGFRTGPFNQSAHFITAAGVSGKIEVVYLEERPAKAEGPYLEEERNLINMLADMIRIYLTRREDILALQKSEANLNSIFINTDTVYMLMDMKGNLIAFNQRAVDYAAKELKQDLTLYANYADYLSGSKREEFTEHSKNVLQDHPLSYEISYEQPTGERSWYYERMLPILNEAKVPYGMMVIISDITEKKLQETEKMERKLQEQKMIIRAILTGEEKERNKIGQELHDNVNQILAGTKLYLSMAKNNAQGAGEIIHESLKLLDSAIEEIRGFSKGKVTPLKKVDLQELLQTLIDRFAETTQVHADFVYEDISLESIEDDLKLNIYRIIQEQLNNIHKHAAASIITLLVNVQEHTIHVAMSDNGKGFDAAKKSKGIGLANIISRVESFNGTIAIESSPGNGCRIEIDLPL